ncbi:hypothetical protein Lfu02_11270 [Longispora fulva]|nr:hypothetical protein Lfu02_11270 [Longispora fulva]
MPQQVVVCGVPRAQRVARVDREADEVELAVGRHETVHRGHKLSERGGTAGTGTVVARVRDGEAAPSGGVTPGGEVAVWGEVVPGR